MALARFRNRTGEGLLGCENLSGKCLFHQWQMHLSQQSILFIQYFGGLFSAMGLHSILYGNKCYYIMVIGAIIFLYVEWIKKHVEYAVSTGCSKENLISAISKIEGMNYKKDTIIITGHPKLRKRIKKIMRL